MAYLDASAIDRIIKAVGKVPDDLDKEQLLSDLELVAAMHRTGVVIRDSPANAARGSNGRARRRTSS